MLFYHLGEVLRFMQGFLHIQDLLFVHSNRVLKMLLHFLPNFGFSYMPFCEFILFFNEADLQLTHLFAFLLKLFVMCRLPLFHQSAESLVYVLDFSHFFP